MLAVVGSVGFGANYDFISYTVYLNTFSAVSAFEYNYIFFRLPYSRICYIFIGQLYNFKRLINLTVVTGEPSDKIESNT